MVRAITRSLLTRCRVLCVIFLVLSCFSAQAFSQSSLPPRPNNKPVQPIKIALPHIDDSQISHTERFKDLVRFLQEYWQIWAIDYGYKVEFVEIASEAARQALVNGEIDVVSVGIYSEDMTEKYLFSLPYAKYKQRLFRRVDADPSKGVQIGIHSSQPTTLDFLSNQIEREYFTDLATLMAQYQRFDALYSSTPWALQDYLVENNLINRFYVSKSEAPSIFFHAMTRKVDRQLMYDINEGLRNINQIQAKLWREKYPFKTTSNIELTLGNYLRDITESEKQFLLDHNQLTYPLPERGFPPFLITKSYTNIAERGFVIDLFKRVTERTGLIFKPLYIPNEQFYLESVRSGKADLLAITNEQNFLVDYVDLTIPFLKARFSLVTRIDSTLTNDMDDLKQERFALLRESTNSVLLKQQLPGATFTLYDTQEEALRAVANGDANVYIGNTLLTAYEIKRLLLANLTSQPMPDFRPTSHYSFAMLKGKQAQLTLLNRTLSSISADEYEQLYDRWSSAAFQEKDVQEHVEGAYRQAGFVIAILLVVVGLIGWIYYRHVQAMKAANAKVEHALAIAEAARADAEKSAQAKITFLARMSHEIRTPMNGVLGMAEELSYTTLSDNQEELLDTLQSSARNLLSLLNDILDFSKIDAGKLVLESVPVDIRELSHVAVAGFKHHENEKPIKLVLVVDDELASTYISDPTRLMQVFNNLLSNAVKFTHQGSITLSIGLVNKKSKQDSEYHTLKIAVKDTGIGIAKENQTQLFTPFIQADSAVSRKFGGTGLGLSICQEIVNAMGSKITINSEEGEGSEFSFALTFKQATQLSTKVERRQQDRTSLPAQDDRFDGVRFLIAEDNLVNVKVLTAQLARLNIYPDVAENGQQALDMHNAQPYDIIISDCHMPELDGFELAKILTSRETSAPLWMIAVTADALSGSAEKCLAAGFDDYMAKPSSQETVADKMHHAYRQFMRRKKASAIALPDKTQYRLFNPKILLKDNGHDLVLSTSVAAMFVDAWPQNRKSLEDALAMQDLENLVAISHKIKGGVHYLVGSALNAAVAEVSDSASDKELDNAKEATFALVSQLDELSSEVSTWLKNQASALATEE
ncbi:ATP-binding protein [Thalassotalea euphylliae]|uniref:ATP-binding protein n=1 Tax=Thalassotalea euphylliae TaxID=1655234 RepID=UPI0036400BD0